MLQLALLIAFAVFAVLCFYFRLRVAMTQGAAARGGKTPEQARCAIERYERFARWSAMLSAAGIGLCVLVGAMKQLG